MSVYGSLAGPDLITKSRAVPPISQVSSSRDIDVEVANRSLGVTATERLLAGFCERSLLKLWTYPNPFKDDGKELCDVLAVFGNHVLVPDMSASSSPGPAPRRAPCLSSSPASSA